MNIVPLPVTVSSTTGIPKTSLNQQLSVIGSNKNLLVRLETRDQIETEMLFTTISRSALEMVYAEVVIEAAASGREEHERELQLYRQEPFSLPCSPQIHSGPRKEFERIDPYKSPKPWLCFTLVICDIYFISSPIRCNLPHLLDTVSLHCFS
ncbi:hypothetical protein V1523DRAFT_114675 [Lipomyces doorenjongii]